MESIIAQNQNNSNNYILHKINSIFKNFFDLGPIDHPSTKNVLYMWCTVPLAVYNVHVHEYCEENKKVETCLVFVEELPANDE